MTTTQTTEVLHQMAQDPQAFDTLLAQYHNVMAQAQASLESVMNRIHRAAGDRRISTRSGVMWNLTAGQAMAEAVRREPGTKLLDERRVILAQIEDTLTIINEMDDVYAEYRWTRFFPSVTKSQPHIHRSLSCHTLHATTVMSWAPQLSGKTDEEAVSELDEALCSVCFPSAPVALHNYVSRHSQAERDERQVAKAERAAKQLAKNLDGSEIFRDHRHDRVTTVAACKELIRKPAEYVVELEWYSRPENTGNRSEAELAQVLMNRTRSLVEADADAEQAAAVLVAREAAHEGWGATAEAIEKMRANKLKSARKEWGL